MDNTNLLSVNSQKSLTQKEEKWYTIKNLADWCGIDVETLKHGEMNLNAIMKKMSINIEVNTRLGGYHNTQKFYSENVLKALKEYQINNGGSNATKNKEVVTSGNTSFIQNQTIQAILDNPQAMMQLVAMSSQRAMEMQQRAEIAETRAEIAEAKNEVLVSDILTWADRKVIAAIVSKYGAKCKSFEQAWSDYKKELLYKHGINLNSRVTAYINKNGKKPNPKLALISDDELPDALRTAIAMCEKAKVEISDIISKSIICQK